MTICNHSEYHRSNGVHLLELLRLVFLSFDGCLSNSNRSENIRANCPKHTSKQRYSLSARCRRQLQQLHDYRTALNVIPQRSISAEVNRIMKIDLSKLFEKKKEQARQSAADKTMQKKRAELDELTQTLNTEFEKTIQKLRAVK